MTRLKPLAIALATSVVLLGGSGANAAELSITKAPRVVGHCQRLQYCHGDVCQWKRVCWHGCPDRYSCAPLYGAYGPYGGRDYWAAYSYGDLRPF
ncbi:hypothetical protein [Bradyrhizobium sp. 2S1]|uniref:hypothetical protein n=1 Tax=Bradyrhizobium sp. 2S1 TaxID=1404429 RepID=UPI00140DFEA7|nr:hypothetical protein [Bradyrhizobium sp. 2S1]MCK7671305.1 hypothetical protein [Bradyrhizobium sp. 2S1]